MFLLKIEITRSSTRVTQTVSLTVSLLWNFRIEIRLKCRTASYMGHLDCVPNRVAIWKYLDDLCVTRLITRVTQTVANPVSLLWTVRMDYTVRHTVCVNHVPDCVLV